MMSKAHIRIVQTSFDALWPVYGQAVDRFYDRLFLAAPEVRRMFPHDMAQQKHKFMQMLASAVGLLEQPSMLHPVVRDLGRRHLDYGVEGAHFDAVRDAVIASLAESLGPRFTPEVEAAWQALLADVRAIMLEGMGQAA